MRIKFILIITLAYTVVSCGSKEGETKLTPVVEAAMDVAERPINNYGPVVVEVSKAETVATMLAKVDGESEVEATFSCEIAEVCKKAGCWINIEKGDGSLFMVRFKDHFTIPTDVVGKKAVVHGVASIDTITVDLLQHFAEDAGKSAEEIAKITESEVEVSFVADGIVLVD